MQSEKKEPGTKEHILHNSIYLQFQKKAKLNYNDRTQISSCLGPTTKKQEGDLWNDGSILYLYCGGDYMGIYIYQNSKLKCSHRMT